MGQAPCFGRHPLVVGGAGAVEAILGLSPRRGAILRAESERNLSKTFRAGVSLGTTLRVHDDDFIATNPPRRDNVYRIGLSVSDSRIRLFDTTPRLSCEYEMQQSNIALHEMNPTVCRISREFRF